MYTVKDISSNTFTLLNEYDIINIEDVKSVSTLVKEGKRKKIIINIEFFDYFFNNNFKAILRNKVKSDLGTHFDLSFGIGF
jgi:hypothetical protein